MYKYIKKENNDIIEAPFKKEVNGNIIYGYNKKSNNDMLINDGYLLYEGTHPNDYIDIVNNQVIQLQYPSIKNIKKNLIEFLYNLKCNIAYTGITMIKNNQKYLFETSQDSITMCNSTLFDLQDLSDDTELSWKVYKEDIPAVIKLTKKEFKSVYTFGKNVMSASFILEGQKLDLLNNMTDEQLSDNDYINEFKNTCRNEFNNINKEMNVDTL